MLAELVNKIENRRATIGVIGLGYVGLPVACSFAGAGFNVIGLDIKPERVATINAGRSPIEGREPGLADLLAEVVRLGRLRATTDYAELAPADVVSINVETPVDDDYRPDYAALQAACRSLGPVMKEGVLVIVESTVAPGTTDRVVGPLLEETSGRKINVGFYLGACPERVMPGKLLANLRGMTRVCGGSTPETAEAMTALYRQIVQAELDATDTLTAELVKTTENTYRDVQIAFANEVARLCEDLGGDVWKVRELVNKSPQRAMHLPGAGVGGHCIPKDPWLLIAHAAPGFEAPLIRAARRVNEAMPLHMAELAIDALRAAGRDIAGAKVAVLGYAYLENSDDSRNTPSEPLVARLRVAGAEVVIHDPFVQPYRGDWLKAVAGADAAIIMVAHDEYRAIDLEVLKAAMRTPVVVDGRRVFDAQRADGLIYRGLGQAAWPA